MEDNLWWDELWTLESRWSPAGRRVYLAFEFDDVTESVAAATRKPIDHHDTDWRTRLDLDKNWSSEFDRFLAEIDELRQDNEDS